MSDINVDDFMGWPEACSALGLAVAVRAASTGHLAVIGHRGRMLVSRRAVARVGAGRPVNRRPRGDRLPSATPAARR